MRRAGRVTRTQARAQRAPPNMWPNPKQHPANSIEERIPTFICHVPATAADSPCSPKTTIIGTVASASVQSLHRI